MQSETSRRRLAARDALMGGGAYNYVETVRDAIARSHFEDVNGDTLIRLLAGARAMLNPDNERRVALENELARRLTL